MDWNKPEKMDQAIEAMLRAEPMRSVPAGFGRKVKARLTVAALLDWERQRQRYLTAAALFLVFSFSGCMLLAVIFPRLLEFAVCYFVPGGAGHMDYILSQAKYGTYNTAAILALPVAIFMASAAGLARTFPRRSS